MIPIRAPYMPFCCSTDLNCWSENDKSLQDERLKVVSNTTLIFHACDYTFQQTDTSTEAHIVLCRCCCSLHTENVL